MFEQKNSELTVYSAKRGEILFFILTFGAKCCRKAVPNSRRTDVNINYLNNSYYEKV